MKISVIVNNYNYEDYVVDAVLSVEQQTFPVDEIIVVDDCSQDRSTQRLREKFSDSQTVKLVLKPQNEGQLAAFQTGFSASTGDLICFLDADDLYEPLYIETIANFYQQHPDCEFLFTCAEVFGHENRIASRYAHTRDLGYSKISTLYRRTWVGHRTSTLSMRRSVLDRMFPIPYLEDWRIRADDCLTYGASIVGAHKFYLAVPLVKYRVHGNNGHYGRSKARSSEYFQQYEQAIERLFAFWVQKLNVPNHLDQFALEEFRSIPQPTREEFATFKSIVRCASLSKLRKAWMLVLVYWHFLRQGAAHPTANSA